MFFQVFQRQFSTVYNLAFSFSSWRLPQRSWLKGTSMLRIHLQNDCTLNIFHNSVLFEGWDLFGDNRFIFVYIPSWGRL